MRLLVVLLAYAIFTLLEFCVLYSLLALLHIRYDEYVANMKFYLASAAITYSLKFLLSSGIKKIHKPMVASSANIKWAPLTIGFPLISLVGISICYYLSMNDKIAAAFVLFFGRFFSYGFAMKILPKKNAASNVRRDCCLITGINCDRRDA